MTIGASGGVPPPYVRPRAGSEGPTPAAESREQTLRKLDKEQEREVAELERIDREVRAHEGAHLAAAGGLARGVSFKFVTGPDGRQYAVSGEVRLDTSPVAGDPEKTIRKAQQIRAAATAPARPSGRDQQVAAQASQMEQAARQELAARQRRNRTEALTASGAPDARRQTSTIEAFA